VIPYVKSPKLVELPASIAAMDTETGTAAVCTLNVLNTGGWNTIGNTLFPSGTWLLRGAAAEYDVMLATTSGTTTSGAALDTWLTLNFSRGWTLTDSTDTGADSFSGTLYIRLNATGTVLASCTVNLTAFAETGA
jgi:hypothetical protein